MGVPQNTRIPRVHKQTLIEMNVAVFTARRDAAHARAVQLLLKDIPPAAQEARLKLYALCQGLLGEAILSTQRSQLQASSPLLRYLKLVRDTVGVNLALLRHDAILQAAAGELSKLVENEVRVARQEHHQAFSESEHHIINCIQNLLKFGHPLLQADSKARLAAFSEDDRRRYELALREYQDYYGARFLPLME